MYTMQGKTRSTRHTLFTLDSRMVPDHTSPMDHVGNLSLVPIRTKQTPTPGRSLGDRRQMSPTVILRHLIPPPSRQPWSTGERFRPSGDRATSAYWAHNTSLRSIRSILARRGPTHQTLTDTGGGYSLEGAGFPHTTPLPSQPTVLPIPPKGPTRSPV
jgi:hypothetical protein